jgi:hypothetical protein
MKSMGKPKYGVIDANLFGFRVVSGIVTGIQYTEDKPLYQLSFGKNSWWTPHIAETPEELFSILELPPLHRIEETHGLKIKYNIN